MEIWFCEKNHRIWLINGEFGLRTYVFQFGVKFGWITVSAYAFLNVKDVEFIEKIKAFRQVSR